VVENGCGVFWGICYHGVTSKNCEEPKNVYLICILTK